MLIKRMSYFPKLLPPIINNDLLKEKISHHITVLTLVNIHIINHMTDTAIFVSFQCKCSEVCCRCICEWTSAVSGSDHRSHSYRISWQHSQCSTHEQTPDQESVEINVNNISTGLVKFHRYTQTQKLESVFCRDS